MKTYVLTVSHTFPATHPRKGEETYFVEKISCECVCPGICAECDWSKGKKIHTIRANFPFWEKRIKEVQEGNAILSLRYWSGKPYKSKQIEFLTLDKDSGCGVQKLDWREMIQVGSERAIVQDEKIYTPLIEESSAAPTIETLSRNDGLSIPDFKAWFKGYDLSHPMAIIHFTGFRY